MSVASVAAGDAVRSGADLGEAVATGLSDTGTLLGRIQSFATSAGSSALAAVTGVETSVATHAPYAIVTAGGDCPLHDCCVASYETLYATCCAAVSA